MEAIIERKSKIDQILVMALFAFAILAIGYVVMHTVHDHTIVSTPVMQWAPDSSSWIIWR